MSRRLAIRVWLIIGLIVASTPIASALVVEPAPPRCFGAAARDPDRPCHNPQLRTMVQPSPAEASLMPNAPCESVERLGELTLCAFGVPAEQATTTVALIGDSHAAHWRAALQDVARQNGWHGVSVSQSGCPLSNAAKKLPEPWFSQCIRWNREVVSWLTDHPEVDLVFVGQIVSRTGVVPRTGRSAFETAVEGYAEAWPALPPSVRRVVVLRDNPSVGQAALDCVNRAMLAGRAAGAACALPRRRVLRPDPAAVAVSRLQSDRIRLLDLSQVFCDHRHCFPVIGGALVYKDGHHLTRVFAATMAPIVERRLVRAGVALRCSAGRCRPRVARRGGR